MPNRKTSQGHLVRRLRPARKPNGSQGNCHIEGWHYTIKDSKGEEVSFGVTSETDDPDKVKEGDHIVAMIREDRNALSIKNIKKKSAPQG